MAKPGRVVHARTVVVAGIALAVLAGCAGKGNQALPLPHVSADPVIQEQLDGYAEAFSVSYPDVALPVVTVERLITADEWAATIVGCLDEAGFRASVSDGGISATGVAPEQMQDYELASYVCKARFPVEPALTRADDAQLEVLYAYFTGPLSTCVKKLGVEVDPEPGLTMFVETYGLAGGWNPYEHVSALPAASMNEVIADCPQHPEGWAE